MPVRAFARDDPGRIDVDGGAAAGRRARALGRGAPCSYLRGGQQLKVARTPRLEALVLGLASQTTRQRMTPATGCQAGARTISMNTAVAQAKITIVTRNGKIDHPISSGIDPWIDEPTFSPRPVPVLDGEREHEDDDEQREERCHRRDEEIHVVHLGGEVGCLFGEECDPRQHTRYGLMRGSAPAASTRGAA